MICREKVTFCYVTFIIKGRETSLPFFAKVLLVFYSLFIPALAGAPSAAVTL